jgi:hypothetical protein
MRTSMTIAEDSGDFCLFCGQLGHSFTAAAGSTWSRLTAMPAQRDHIARVYIVNFLPRE